MSEDDDDSEGQGDGGPRPRPPSVRERAQALVRRHEDGEPVSLDEVERVIALLVGETRIRPRLESVARRLREVRPAPGPGGR